MKKVIITVVLLLAVSATPSFAASQNRCDRIIEVNTQLNSLHEFIRNAHGMDEVQYYEELNKLNDSTNKIYDNVKGCDGFSDDVVVQMKGAIRTLLNEAQKYRA